MKVRKIICLLVFLFCLLLVPSGVYASDTYTVTFDSNEGSAINNISAEENSLIIEPSVPNREGYIFDGWYKGPELIDEWNFSSDKITGNITLYAKWVSYELQTLRNFLNQPSSVAGKTNGQVLSSNYNQNLTNTWSSCFTWSFIDGQDHITSIRIYDKHIAGKLNLDGFTKLTKIRISNTDLTSISVSNNNSLTSVYFSMNYNLTSLNIDSNIILNSIECTNNRLVTLKIKNSPKLNELNCCCNYEITSLGFEDITTLTVLKCNGNELSAIDVSKNIGLVTLDCSFNKITTLDLSKNTSLNDFNCSYNLLSSLNISSQERILTKLNCSNNKISLLNVSNCLNLESLLCGNNKLTYLNVNNNTKLKTLDCGYNSIKSLNLNNNTLLEKLNVDKLGLCKLDVSKRTALKSLSCSNNNITSLDLSKNTNLTNLYCCYCDLMYLDLSNNKLLELVHCDGNNISILDFSNNPKLIYLRCVDNNLKILNITKNVNLWDAACQLNNLTSLDISNNTKLYALDCGRNSLTSLNLYNNCDLYRLNCENNAITQLDTSTNLKLEILVCDSNFLTSIDISKNILLRYFRCENNQLKYIKYIYKNVVSDIASEGSGYITIKIDTYNPPYIEIFAIPCSGSSFVSWSMPNAIYSMNANSRITSSINNTLTANFSLAKPKISSVKSSGYDSITLKWNSVTGADSYNVYRAASKTGKYSKIGTTESTSYKDTGLTTGKYYYYKVKAACITGSTTTYSVASSYKYTKPIPSKPAVTVSKNAYTSLKISWNAIDGATGYKIYRATSKTGKYSYIKTTTSTSYINKSLITGKTYYYKVRAYKTVSGSNVYSYYSTYKYAKVVPSTPMLKAVSSGSASIKLSWNEVGGATKYEVYRKKSGDDEYKLIKTTSAESYTDSSLITGVTYYYKVRAYHLEGKTKVFGSFAVASAASMP